MNASLTIPVSIAKDLLTGAEWSPADTRDLLQRTAEIKSRPSKFASVLRGKHIALIFEKPSLRTRVTFEVGIQSMGGDVVFLDHTQARLGERESIPDVARNLECWVQGIVARVYEQRVLEEMAASIKIPVVNALSDKFHPCQALADYFTLEEKFGSLKNLKIAYVGDGNNVCHSLMFLAVRLGVNLRIATPANYAPAPDVVADSKRVAKDTRARIELFTDPSEAVAGAQAVYTDSWTSMGFDRKKRFAAMSSSLTRSIASLWSKPRPADFHALPAAHSGAEVTKVVDSPTSIVLNQSENRMYVQKAILHALFS